jgi:hypothetical protein
MIVLTNDRNSSEEFRGDISKRLAGEEQATKMAVQVISKGVLNILSPRQQ